MAPAALERAGADLTALYRVLRREHAALRIDAPVLLLQNETDPEVPKALTDRLKDQLEALGNEVRYRTYPAAGHASVIKTGAAAFEDWLHARLGR